MDRPTKVDKVKYALYRTLDTGSTRSKKAKWVVYGAAALSTVLLFACDVPSEPKIPKYLGD